MEQSNSFSRDKTIWLFNSGEIFTGNPKWLFTYVNNYRKDINAYWLCNRKETLRFVRSLGYKAISQKSSKGRHIMKKAGVYVCNQAKEVYPPETIGAVVLNLWHGVGCKTVERKVNFGFLSERIVKKYIKNNSIYRNNQIFLVTSPLMEKHFKEQCGLDDNQIIRAGYPCCMNQEEKLNTFDHNIRKVKGLSSDTKIAIYCPTYRDSSSTDFFGKAIPDMERLIENLKQENMLLIFKMHPLMEKDYVYKSISDYYKDCPNLLFWDNGKDIYEIFSQIDLAIVDYSSIFYDMLAAGVKHFVRYIFDYEDKNNLRGFVFDYKEMTVGRIASNYDELLESLGSYEIDIEQSEIDRIYDLFWSYSDEHSCEKIIEAAMAFEPLSRKFPTLYSFDIFDTLIHRKVNMPIGVFYGVRDMMRLSDMEFPLSLTDNFPKVRHDAEANVREYYRKSKELRNSDRLEITFDEIYDRIAYLYELTEEQTEFLKKCELDIEYENCIPDEKMIQKVEKLVASGETVLLISDMYLPKEFILKMLAKVSSVLPTLPLYLSSDKGGQKTNKKLFIQAYSDLDYRFDEWVHCGDNPIADDTKPSQLGITSELITIPEYNKYEECLIEKGNNYGAYLAAALMMRFRQTHPSDTDYYAYAYVSSYFVSYVAWIIDDAIKKGIKCLYFLARDGYYLKLAADAIIETKGLDIRTKYIYGSRKAWRVPSYIDSVDSEMFGYYGNIIGIDDFSSLLDATCLTETEFDKFFPDLSHIKNKKRFNASLKRNISKHFQHSSQYLEHLLHVSAIQREKVVRYLNQEIDFSEKFAFVEYWGRGYTQDCFARLAEAAAGKQMDIPFYYARSIYPSMGHSIRYNYTTNTTSLIMVEALFANMPYHSITEYIEKDGRIEPVIIPRDNDAELHAALEKYLPQFARDFYSLDLIDREQAGRTLFDFGLEYFELNPTDPIFVKKLAHLKDAVALYSGEIEFAPKMKLSDILKRFKGERFHTKSHAITFARSSKLMAFVYSAYIRLKEFAKEHTLLRKILKKMRIS